MIVTPLLKVAYNFNGNKNDESGYAHNLTGTATIVDGNIGQCANFNGSQYLSSNNIDLSDTDKLTICFWIKFSKTSLQIIAENSVNFNNNNNAFLIDHSEYGSFGAIQFSDHATQGYNISYTSKSYNDGKWHFVAITSDRSQNALNQTSIYVDLVKDTILHSEYRSDLPGNYSTFPLFLGSRNNSQYFFNGQISRFHIYKKILSLTDIQRIYECSTPLNG